MTQPSKKARPVEGLLCRLGHPHRRNCLSLPPTNAPTGANSEASFPGGLPHPFQNCAGGLPRSSPGLGGPVTALAFFDGWVIPTVKKGHAFRLGQGMGPTVAGVAPIRPPWGRGPRDAPPSAPTPPPCAPIRPHWGEDLRKVCHTSGRSATLLEGLPEDLPPGEGVFRKR